MLLASTMAGKQMTLDLKSPPSEIFVSTFILIGIMIEVDFALRESSIVAP